MKTVNMYQSELKAIAEMKEVMLDIRDSLYKTWLMKTSENTDRNWASSEEGKLFTSICFEQGVFINKMEEGREVND